MTTATLSRLGAPDAATDPAAALAGLLSRQSCWPLAEPGPNDRELDAIFAAAMRAPDHGNLKPWRFVLIRGEARRALGDVLVGLADAREPDAPTGSNAHRAGKALAAPVLIAIGAAIVPHRKVPETEQLLAAGAAAMNLLNAVHLLGYGGFWSTGVDSREPALHDALGFAPNERLLGFLYVGTPAADMPATPRPAAGAYVREWRSGQR
ncbi:nitroreductase family protein [Burkholderia plantarii]|uniref:nitroreductase family protein n=1 Tax=Burkholderia plantarii TaxID=41899 RepID=UPI0006D8A0F5|nr:nitroreductase [Burkholderia plantarii]ALK33479.1 nitroreductase family protein [Burkholderia plantarii]WLE62535.1 nitroreductase [Burkholderia plantarii]GLZ16652.1 nitroreductase [Burkholderia plantarii]